MLKPNGECVGHSTHHMMTKRMKKVGRVEIPQGAFLAVLKVNE